MSSASQLCTFYVDDMFFGVDVRKVQEVLRHQPICRVPLAPPVVAGLINLRGQIVVALDLRKRLGLPPNPAGDPAMNVVLSDEGGAVSLQVDSIDDVVSVDAADFEPRPETVRGEVRDLIEGVYKLGGRLLLLLDTERATNLNISASADSEVVP
jgi:purine-binding chemotaxis protein CheW